MDEFTDIYRIYTKNYLNTSFEDGWDEKEVELFKRKLDAVGSLIENGDIIIDILKREINDSFDCPYFNIILEHVALALFKIEKRANSSKPTDRPIDEPEVKPTVEPTDEPEDEPKVKHEVKPETTTISSKVPFNVTLHRYGNATIYKEVYVHLLETLLDKFNYTNVYNSIYNIYKEKAKRELKHKTLLTYTGRYIEYMTMKGKIKIDKKSGMYVKTIQEPIIVETPEKPDIEKPDDKWTEDEDELIKKYYPTMTAAKVKIKLPHHSKQAIYDRAYLFKIQKLKHREKEPEKQKLHDLHGKWIGSFPKDQVLTKCDSICIYKPVVDEIMDDKNLPDEFTRKDLTKFLFNYYNHVLKRKLTLGSADVYKSKYIIYLLENNLVKKEIVEGMTPNKFIKIKDKPSEKKKKETSVEKPTIAIEEPIVEKPAIEKSTITIVEADDIIKQPVSIDEKDSQPVSFADGETLDELIYNYAVEYGWVNAPSLPVLTVERRFSEYTSDEIGIALAKLIQGKKAFQANPGRIKFFKINLGGE